MTTVAIVQARMTSSRLPGKVMAEIGGEPLLGHMLGRLARCRNLDAICVATTSNSADDEVASCASTFDAAIVRGDEHDVLGRFALAAEATGADAVVRLTADCPMTDPALVDEIVRSFRATPCDYRSNVVFRDFPDGLDVEIFTREALDRAVTGTTDRFDREHVTTFIRRQDTEFKPAFRLTHHRGPADFSHLRWTVDTPLDLENVRALTADSPPDYGWLDALSALTKNPALLQAMTVADTGGPNGHTK